MTARIDRIAALVTSGAVRVPEITTYKLSEAAAHAVSEGRHCAANWFSRSDEVMVPALLTK